MKKGLHPQFNNDATITCACGNTFVAGSTQDSLQTEICSSCHPFYTGKQKLIDATGTVDRFKKRTAVAAQKKSEVKVKKPRKARTAKK